MKREANHGSRDASASQGGTPVAPRARGCACVDDERRSLCSLVATMGLHAAACSTKISHGGVRRVAPQQPRRVGPPPPTPQAQKKHQKYQTQRAQIAMASSNRPITLRICRKLSSKCTVLLKDSSQFNQFAFDGPRMHHHSIVWPTPHDLWRSQRRSTRPIHWKFCRCHVHRCHADNVEPSIGDHKALCARVPGRQQICELYTARQGCTRCITFRLLLIL